MLTIFDSDRSRVTLGQRGGRGVGQENDGLARDIAEGGSGVERWRRGCGEHEKDSLQAESTSQGDVRRCSRSTKGRFNGTE